MPESLARPSVLEPLRRQLRAARRELGAQARHTADTWLCAQLHAYLAARGARQVLGYWPQGSEPDLRPLLRRWMAAGGTVGLPAVTRRTPCDMAFHAWQGQEVELQPDVWGIPAPAPDAPVLVPGRDTVILVPGLGFTAEGDRLGAGAGCYDRWLAAQMSAMSRPWLIGVAYACQQLDQLPTRPWDVPMDAVIFAPASSS